MCFFIATIFFFVFIHIDKAFMQGVTMSPCPQIFQYRFNGTEWNGLLSVRNPALGDDLHLQVTLSLKGKPTTSYLGAIELLTRGQFASDTPVWYKIKFPKSQFPPKLIQIITNNKVICRGKPDRGVFVTQIQLEHTRKFTFIQNNNEQSRNDNVNDNDNDNDEDNDAGIADIDMQSTIPKSSAVETETTDGVSKKHLSFGDYTKNHMRSRKAVCGKVDERIGNQIMHALGGGISNSASKSGIGASLLMRRPTTYAENAAVYDISNGATNIASETQRDITEASKSDILIIDDDSNSSSMVGNIEQPSMARGAWPWMATIYVNNSTSLVYQCGGTLVSERIVISSAHCFELFGKQYTTNEVMVSLGRHNLKNWNEEGSVVAPVNEIYIHPDYNSHLKSYDADIVVIILRQDVSFSTFIRPACLWSGSTELHYVVGEPGTVVSWNLRNSNMAEFGSSTAVPTVIQAPIVSNEVCFKANRNFSSLTSQRTFCAGIVTATTAKSKKQLPTGPCTGDSGAGLLIYKNDQWILRGVISASLLKPSGGASCAVNQYVIYADVAKFLNWISAFL